jgi:FMN-dependent NADH-azoreductase
MSKLFKVIHNVTTGEIQQIDLTAEEIAVVEADEAAAVAEAQAKAKTEADKAVAQAKLTALGLTADDLKALGL